MDELTEIADRAVRRAGGRLHRGAQRRGQGVDDKALAAQVKKLKKPSVAAWSINLLVRRESAQIDSVLRAGRVAPGGCGGPRRRRAAGADPAAAPAHHGPRVHGALARPRGRRAADRPGRRAGRGDAQRGDARPGGGAGRAHRPGADGVHLDGGLRAGRVVGGRASPRRSTCRLSRSRGRSRMPRTTVARASRSGCTSYPMTERSWPQPRTRSRRRPDTSPRPRRTWRRSRARWSPSTPAGSSCRARPTSCAAGWPRSRTTSTRSTTSWRRPRRPGRPRSRSSRRRGGRTRRPSRHSNGCASRA